MIPRGMLLPESTDPGTASEIVELLASRFGGDPVLTKTSNERFEVC